MSQCLLLCTDLDRTLLPNGDQPESPEAREYFRRLVTRSEVTLAYVTGRHQQLVEQAIRDYQLPEPNFVIADVGSTVYELQAGSWTRWVKWEDVISTDWLGNTHLQLSRMLDGFSQLDLQENEKQNTHKLSYYTSENIDQQGLFEMLHERFNFHGVKTNLIWSLDDNAGTGLLDILPASAGKRKAIEFLMGQCGFTIENTVFSGDSGNDLEVLVSPIPATLVANASRDVKRMAQRQADIAGYSNALYLAQGGYLDMNGHYSAGILEGVVHYMPVANDWLSI
jgi:sucrose-6F-phosphate phosphohydrolase